VYLFCYYEDEFLRSKRVVILKT